MASPYRVLLLRVGPPGIGLGTVGPPPVAPPLGLLSVAAALREAFAEDEVAVEVRHLSLAIEDLDALPPLLRDAHPDLVGLSALTIDEARLAACARLARQSLPGAKVVVGGPHATINAPRVLSFEAVDAAVVGEGEQTLVQMVKQQLAGQSWHTVPGVATRGPQGMRLQARPFVSDLDALPSPAWDLVDLQRYSRLFNFHDLPPLAPPYAPVVTSRGCPYRCVYCHGMFGREFRAHSAARVVQELRLLAEEHGVGEIHIVDDIFNLQPARLEAICDGLIDARLDLEIAFPNGLRGDIMSARQLTKLRDAGCYSITFALETATARLQKMIRKNLRVERVLEAARVAADLGLVTSCFVMLGFPTETAAEARHTVQVVADSAFDLPRVFKVCPFPGTELFDLAVQHGFDPGARGGEHYDYDAGLVNVSAMPDEVLGQVVQDAHDQILDQPRRQQRLAAILDRFPAHPIFDAGGWRSVKARLGRS